MEIKQMMAELLLSGLRCSSQGNSAQGTSLQLTEPGTSSVIQSTESREMNWKRSHVLGWTRYKLL